MPALFTRMSTRPNVSMVEATILSALAGSPIETVEATAWPPFFLISLTTSWAGAGVAAGAVERHADVVDDNLGAFFRQQERDGAADAAARAGNDGDFVLDDTGHSALCSFYIFGVTPGLTRGSILLALKRRWIAGSSPAMTAERVAGVS